MEMNLFFHSILTNPYYILVIYNTKHTATSYNEL